MERSYHLTSVSILALATIAFLVLSPLTARADIGIAAIAIDSSIEGKGSFDTNGGINVGDIITTGGKGSLTILFDDESMLTLGPNAKAQVVQYSQTPPPGVSEIKIISGGFRYFPGTILENGGKQVLYNEGDSSNSSAIENNSNLLETDIPDYNLAELNDQLTDVTSQITDLITSTEFSNAADGANNNGQGTGGDDR